MDSSAFELTLEQQFQMSMMERSTHQLTHEQLADLLMQLSRQLMVKDNVIRNLLGKGLA